MIKKLSFQFLYCLILSLFLASNNSWSASKAKSDPFPVYDSIKPNVEFWVKIFSQHASNEGLLHDKDRLEVIYEVIPLAKTGRRTDRKTNKKRIKSARKKIETILKKLGKGKPPSNQKERAIAALFGPNTKSKEYRKAAKNIRFQTGVKDRFKKGIVRSGAYLDFIKKKFQSYGLPQDLAYLPHVESAFNVKAYSKFGAAGIWQFTRSTGRRYLSINYTVDERRDPFFATEAAAKFMKYNFSKLNNWPITLTAYNHGLNGMMRAKKKHGNYPNIVKKYSSRSFKFASKNFYSEFLAARIVAKSYKKHFGSLILDKPVKSKELILPGFISIKNLVNTLGLSVDQIRKFNPALRKPVYNGQKYIPKNYLLKVPFTSKNRFAKIDSLLPKKLFSKKQKPSLFHMVKRGETVSKIARIHGVKTRDLILANNLDRRATIYSKQNLRIPQPSEKFAGLKKSKTKKTKKSKTKRTKKVAAVSKKKEIAVVAKKAAKPSLPVKIEPERVAKQEVITKPVISIAESTTTEPVPVITELATLSQGETEAKDMVESNNLQVNLSVVTGNFMVEKMYKKRGKQYGVLRVAVDETLGHYADWLSVATQEVRRLNGFRYGKAIHLNQKIKIPLYKVSKEEFEVKRFENQKEIEEDFFASYKVEKLETYQVKKGDNIWTLSRDVFEIPFWLVIKYNVGADLQRLKLKQKIMVPVIEKIDL